MKIKVINGFDGDCEFKEPHIRTMTEYCKRFGYEYVSDLNIREGSPYEKENGYWWLKLYMIQKHLSDCDYLLWVDTDTIAINYGTSLDSFLGFDIAMKKEATEEAGIMLFRNCEWVKDFLKVWGSKVRPDFNDNEVLTGMLMIDESLKPHFKFFEGSDFSVKHPHFTTRNNNTLFMHCSGCTTEDKVEYMNEFSERWSFKDCYSSFVNLDHRTDRLEHMKSQLSRIGLDAERTRGLLPREVDQPATKLYVMQNRTPGAIGCHYSQVSVIEKAYEQGKSAFVMEDDLVFCEDFNERIPIIENFLNNHEWDVFWMGGTYHVPAQWHSAKHNPDLPLCECTLNRDVEQTEDSRIMRTYGIWSTYAYIVNYKSIPKILELLDQKVYLSMGIDWLFISLQPTLLTYCFAPGCIKQMDNLSDIGVDGNGRQSITHFSGFKRLGEHWYQERMNDFNPKTYAWK